MKLKRHTKKWRLNGTRIKIPSPEATEKFKEITEAYTKITNPDADASNIDINDIFSSIFNEFGGDMSGLGGLAWTRWTRWTWWTGRTYSEWVDLLEWVD